jgi:hypothetical protein
MKLKKSVFCWIAAPLLALACSAGAPATNEEASSDATVEQSQQPLTAATLLNAFENVAVELEARSSAGTLEGDLATAWQSAAQVRSDAAVEALIAALRNGAPAEDVLAFDSAVIEKYVTSFDAVVETMQKQAANGSLDEKLALLLSQLEQRLKQVETSDDVVGFDRAATYCCVVKNTPTTCHQYHTAGVWAGSKCVAAGVGLNRSGSTLLKMSCSYGYPTYCATID